MDFKNFRKVNLSELQCLPSLVFFQECLGSDALLLEAHESYQKGGFRNRYFIQTSQGPLEMSIPLQGGRNVRALIQEVKVDDRLPWRWNHLQSIETAYRSTPYYEYLAPELKEILQMPTDSLWELNEALLRWVWSVLRWDKFIGKTTDFYLDYSEGNVVDLRKNAKNKEGESLSILHYLFHFGPELALILENENNG
jgi:hypothetical protein